MKNKELALVGIFGGIVIPALAAFLTRLLARPVGRITKRLDFRNVRMGLLSWLARSRTMILFVTLSHPIVFFLAINSFLLTCSNSQGKFASETILVGGDLMFIYVL